MATEGSKLKGAGGRSRSRPTRNGSAKPQAGSPTARRAEAFAAPLIAIHLLSVAPLLALPALK